MAAAAVAGGRQRIAHMKETAMKHLEKNIDRASVHIQTGNIDNPRVYSETCMKLGSFIDWVIAVNAFPSSSHLPKLVLIVKEVYRRQTELLQPSLMLLMLSIKAACQIGWFPDGDKDGLLMLAKEVSYGFSNTEKMNIEPSNAHSSVSDIVSRFYPTMKLEHILTSFDVKAGYGTFVADFYISRGATPRHCRNVWLLVAQLDNMDTAACITNPSNVDFLINGSVIPNRTRNDMGNGPQLPTDITKLIKYGLNLLQVFGDFDGQYIIALAFMNKISSPDPCQLQDYFCPMSGGDNLDCDVSEMSLRISLCCPISQHRIKTPVKGHLCNHPQCFDYHNFIEMNSTKPTWKCPLCDNPVSNHDVRIDRDFLKILNDVAKDVNDVIISEDGSWMVADTNRDPMRHATVTTPAVPPGPTQVNVCTTKQAQSTAVFMQTTGCPGQTRVNVSTTNQAQSTTMFTPPATVTKPTVPPGQTEVSATNQAQSTTMFTPTAESRSQTQVNVGTTEFITVTKPTVPPGQTHVSATNQAQSTTIFTPTADSCGQCQVNVGTTTQDQSTTMFTPRVCPGQTQVNVGTTMQAKSSAMFRPPAGSPGQIRVNEHTTKQAQTTTMFTLPAAATKPTLSPGQTQVNACTTTKAKSTTMFRPPASQPAPNTSQVSPTQLQEARDDATPSVRMRGSLKGDQLQAARLKYLALPQQPARANEQWSRPQIPSFPSPFLVPKPPTNSENV